MKSGMPWFKLYADARLDKKLGILTLAERGVWVNLLCYASEQGVRGVFDATDRYTLAMECADGDETILESTIEKLLKVRHLVPCNDHVTSDLSLQRYMFRTFEARQAQKVSNFPSDAPERVKARVAKYRASHKQPSLRNEHVTSVTSSNGTEREREREEERDYPLSGKGSYIAEDVERGSAPTSAAAGSTNHSSGQNAWTDMEAHRVAKRIAGRLKLVNPDMEGLVAVLKQHTCAPPYLEAESAKCLEWHTAKGRKVTIRLFDNWLAKDATRKELERQQQQSALQNNGHSNGLNGNHSSNGKESTSNGTTQSSTLDPTKDPEHLKRYARLVQQRGQRQAAG